MAKLDYHLFPYLADNYGVLIHDTATGQTAAVDTGDASALLAALKDTGWALSHLWITHHHWDHTDGLLAVKEATGCKVLGPRDQSTPISGLDDVLVDGEVFDFAGHRVRVLSTPGHTTDMINFYIEDENVLFSGDTLFTLGCGRLFEGTPPMMWDSLSKIMQLPINTLVYGAHEYTLANAQFALTIDPTNIVLQERAKEIEQLRANDQPTVPTLLSDEVKTNPFLRASDKAIRAHLGMEAASDAEVFAEIRKRKDSA